MSTLDHLRKFWKARIRLNVLRDTRGQDLVEYALLVSLAAVSAGAVIPDVADSITTVFGQVQKELAKAGGAQKRTCEWCGKRFFD